MVTAYGYRRKGRNLRRIHRFGYARLAEKHVSRSVALSIILPDMRISDRALDEFIELYREEFGEEIGRSEASEMAFRLATLYELLAKQRPGENDAGDAIAPDDQSRQPIGFRI